MYAVHVTQGRVCLCVSLFNIYLHLMVGLQKVNIKSKYCNCQVSYFFLTITLRNIYFIIYEYIFSA